MSEEEEEETAVEKREREGEGKGKRRPLSSALSFSYKAKEAPFPIRKPAEREGSILVSMKLLQRKSNARKNKRGELKKF